MAEPEFNRAERYGRSVAEAAGETPEAPKRPSLKPLYLAGGAMIATTLAALLIGAPSWLAALLGVAVFLGGLVWARREGAKSAAPSGPRRRQVDAAAAERAGLDPVYASERLNEAEGELAEIDALARHPMLAPMAAEIREVSSVARQALDHLETDPGDLDRAQKFLRVFLPSARASLEKYSAFDVREDQLEADMRGLVGEMRAACERLLAALKSDERVSLEVEMEVLSERLRARE